jgi:ubiquinone/menaquinone biosynthesis C-methylase UbiE
MVERVPLNQEPIAEADAVAQYDKGARLYIFPEYKYFVWKILRHSIRSGRVLDIGTGSGRLAIELAKANGSNFEIIGLDISEAMLLKAQDNARQAGVHGKVKFVLGTAADLPFPDESFDLVVSYASLHHWFEPVNVFNEAQRVVKDNGVILIRDNQRVYGNPFWEAFIWAISRFMNHRHRFSWPKAILASYTVPEVKAMLKESGLKNYRVSTDFIKFDVCIESPVRAEMRNSSCRKRS